MDVSVILVNFNSIQLVIDAIDSIFLHSHNIEFETIVIDNHSEINSKTDLHNKYTNLVKYIYLDKNIGFGNANNVGLKYASGRNIFFLNPDTKLINNALKLLSDYLDKNDLVGICGGNLYDINLKPTSSYMSFLPSIWSEINNLFFNLPFKIIYGKNLVFNYSKQPKSVGYITGADLMIKRSVLNQVGSFDSDFFLYYEETELSYRVKKNGYEIISVPTAEIIHLESQTISNNLPKQVFLNKSRKLYYQKTQTKFSRYTIDLVFCMTCWSRIIILSIGNKKMNAEYWKNEWKCFKGLI